MWIERNSKLYNLSKYDLIMKYGDNQITMYIKEDSNCLFFDSKKERDDFFDQIRFKLFPDRFGGIPC